MPVETAADRTLFLNLGDFACEGTYTPIGGAPVAIIGIFDAAYLEVDIGGEAPAASSGPRFSCRIDDVTNGGKEGDLLNFSQAQLLAAGLDVRFAGTYKVINPQPDGTGMVDLILHKA